MHKNDKRKKGNKDERRIKILKKWKLVQDEKGGGQ